MATHCTCTGFWHCSRMMTPPPTDGKASQRKKTFIQAYQEAKEGNILTCPYFNPSEIGRKIDTFRAKRLS